MRLCSLVISISLALNVPVYCDDPSFQQKGYKLTQDSWIFSPDKAKDVRNRLVDLDTEKQLNESLNKSLSLEQSMNKIQDDKITLLLKQNNDLVQSVDQNRGMNDWSKILWFTLGVVVSGLAIYGAKGLSH